MARTSDTCHAPAATGLAARSGSFRTRRASSAPNSTTAATPMKALCGSKERAAMGEKTLSPGAAQLLELIYEKPAKHRRNSRGRIVKTKDLWEV